MVDANPTEQVQTSGVQKSGNDSRKPRKRGGKALIIVAILFLAIALSGLGFILYTYMQGQEEYDSLVPYLHVEDESHPNLGNMTVDWKGLSKINSDIVGWIYFPKTNINYPIVWREGDDAYYMKHNFGQNSVGDFGAEYGCPVLSSVNSPKWTDQANFVAGHNMINGTMFTFFESMQESDVFNSHRTIYILTPEGNFRLEAITCNKIMGSSTSTVIPNFETEQEFHDYIQERVDSSLVKPKPALGSIDDIKQIMAFYTCSEPDNTFRIIVYAEVKEYLPTGSDKALESSMVDQRYIDKIDSAVNERLK